MAFQKRFTSHRGITIIQKRDPEVRSLRPGKAALVLAGGAVTGAAHKVGGLQALDEIFARRRVDGARVREFGLCDFDLFVGLSAGSVLAALFSVGVTPEQMARNMLAAGRRYQPLQFWDFMWPNLGELPRRWLGYLARQQEVLTNYLSGATDERTGQPFDGVSTLLKMLSLSARLLPTGLFTTERLERYVRRNFELLGLPNDFAKLHERTGNSLYLSATDLNHGRLVMFGHDEPYRTVPVSQAIAASCALPLWYRPVRLPNPRAGEPGEPDLLDLADGALMRTANVRVAVEKGAQLVICYNPFTRIVYDRRGRSLYEHGAYAIAQQAARILIGARLDLAKELVFSSDDFDADVVFIEPAPDDYHFFRMNPLSFWNQLAAVQHGHRSVQSALAANHGPLSELFATHGIELRPPRQPGRVAEPAPVDVREARGQADH